MAKNKKKVRRRKCFSPLLQKMLDKKDHWKQAAVANRTGIAQGEDAFEALKRFVADGEKEYEPLILELEEFASEDRDRLLRQMVIKEIKRL